MQKQADTTTPFDKPLVFDTSKFPPGLRTVPSDELTGHLRAVYLLIAGKSHNRDRALEVAHEVLFRVTAPDWRCNPSLGTLREQVLAVAKVAYSELRYGNKKEKRACAEFAHSLGKQSWSPEEIAIYVEEQADLDARDAADAAAASAVVKAVAHHPLAPRILEVWAEHGSGIPPREIAKLLGVPVPDVKWAIQRIHRCAESQKVRDARRTHGTRKVHATPTDPQLRWRSSGDSEADETTDTEEGGAP